MVKGVRKKIGQRETQTTPFPSVTIKDVRSNLDGGKSPATINHLRHWLINRTGISWQTLVGCDTTGLKMMILIKKECGSLESMS